MKSFKLYQKSLKEETLEERALHAMFKSIDIKLARASHKRLQKSQVISKHHKFGDIITRKDIDTYFSHMDDFSHNYREEIEAYNKIIQRDQKEIRKIK